MLEAEQFIKRFIWSLEHHGPSILARFPLLQSQPSEEVEREKCVQTGMRVKEEAGDWGLAPSVYNNLGMNPRPDQLP